MNTQKRKSNKILREVMGIVPEPEPPGLVLLLQAILIL
jgi:hypothetical protein